MLKITQRCMTPKDIKKLANSDFPNKWGELRSISKTINFGTLFGAEVGTIVKTLKEAGVTDEKFVQLFEDLKLQKLYDELNIKPFFLNMESELAKQQYTVGTFFRKSFFDTYKGFEKRIERNRDFAKKFGYVRSVHGAFRHLPELKYCKHDDNGNMGKKDKSIYGGVLSTCLNAAANTSIQSWEIPVVFPAMVMIQFTFKVWELKSLIWNYTYDSIDLYVYEGEEDIVSSLVQFFLTREVFPEFNMPIEIDGVMADLTKGEVYKGGSKVKFIPLEQAILNYEQKNGKMLNKEILSILIERERAI